MNSRVPLIAGNWKMHKDCVEAIASAEKLKALCSGVYSDREIMIAPPFTALYPLSSCLTGTGIKLAGQNVYWAKEGAYTGEISAKMLKSAGCEYVIIGHSERRQIFGETDTDINSKIRASIEAGLAPVFCIGETDSEKENGKTFFVLDRQLENGLKDVPVSGVNSIVIAYEPVWAIGTGKTATPETAQKVHAWIRSFLEKKYGEALAKSVRIIYGGSVKPDNISGLMQLPDLDGVLVGGASLEPESFFSILRYNKL
ncbi:triose-phosphate isomerase [Desulforegula conservatrix]|uniref:triose-phosphate isomerase n=1 Tax=Desulforegula conservatrix TaxID=153026 RepID=UPI0003FFA2CF|nr:triose-phosphate isomerase [Desulforegula conservatrix]